MTLDVNVVNRAAAERKFRLPRLWSNAELRRIGPLFEGDVINVSAGDDVDKEGKTYDTYFPNKSNWYISNHAPGAFRGFQDRPHELLVDLTADLPGELERRFDVVFNHTTLEHIFEVRTAFANLCRMSKDVVIVVVPFAQIQHEVSSYKDYWRFTPTCLRRLFQENGLSVVYEAESSYENAGVYLLFVGCRDENKWKARMPHFTPCAKSGSWIGRIRPLSVNWFARKLTRFIDSGERDEETNGES